MFRQWYNLAMLASECQQVIGLRIIRLTSGGPRAASEANLMVSEKIAAASRASGQIMTGASPDAIVRGYRRKVKANVRRLWMG